MFLLIEWLKDYIDINLSPDQLVGKLTLLGHMLDKKIEEGVYDLEIRQNRADCLSVIGLAREAAAIQGISVTYPEAVDIPSVDNHAFSPSIRVEADDLVNRFKAVLVEVSLGPSPAFISQRLREGGINPVNNVVDITNYVMLEYGEPLHAFDADKIKQGLVLRRAVEGEKLTTFEGTELSLTAEELVIASGDRVGALAGVIGGRDTGVSEETSKILIEAGNYHQANVRRSSIRLATRTDASTRLEKFLPPHLCQVALRRALFLLTKYAQGKVLGPSFDYYPHPPEEKQISLTAERLSLLSGMDIPLGRAVTLLKQLEFKVEGQGSSQITVVPPYYRTDVVMEDDVIEEVIRLIGYDKVPESLPERASPAEITPPLLFLADKIRDILTRLGSDEVISDPLVKANGSQKQVTLANPLNADKNALRTSIFDTLRPALKLREGFRSGDVVFEIGRVYFHKDAEYQEVDQVAVLVAPGFQTTPYGLARSLLKELSVCHQIEPAGKGWRITSGGILLGELLEDGFYLELEALLDAEVSEEKDSIIYLPNTVVKEAVSFILDEDQPVGPIAQRLLAQIDNLSSATEDDVYRQVGDGKKSVTLGLIYRKPRGLLLPEEIEEYRREVVKVLQEFDAELRVAS